MQPLTIIAGAMQVAALLAVTGVAQAKGDFRISPCERSTLNMQKACKFDARDNYQETIANCRQLGDADERNSCREEAVAERSEEMEFCLEQSEARSDACRALGEWRYDPDTLLDSALAYINPDEVPAIYPPNPFVSIAAGHTYVLRAGDDGEEIVVVHVSEESREIQGVLCRVVLDLVFEVAEDDGDVGYEIVENTDDWFAQTTGGDVVYCGEVARNYEDGVLRDLDGSFESGIEFAKAGFLVKAMPVPGDTHRQEFALGEAEDIVEYVSLNASPTEEEGGENPNFPCAGQCLKTFDYAPIDPEATEYKYYLPGVGFVLAVGMEDGELTGEREELICVGESPDILAGAACGIENHEALLEELCINAPDAFCD